MPVNAAEFRIGRSRAAEPSDALGHLDHSLRSATTDLLSELGKTTTVSGALAIANLLKDHIAALADLQTLARVRASGFISRAADPFSDGGDL